LESVASQVDQMTDEEFKARGPKHFGLLCNAMLALFCFA